MAGYRFCRSDDVPLLVEAYNACYRVHFPELPELSVDAFKRWIREIQVWASSCMLATDRGAPIGILIGAKRETASCIVALGVRPDHLRQGHGSHMLASLGRKLAIIGPPRIVAEVPEPLAPAQRCFESCGYRLERTYTDYVLEDARVFEAAPHPLVAPIGVAEAADAGLLQAGPPRCWDRAAESLLARRDRIEGLAIASESRIEAFLLYSLADGGKTCHVELIHATRREATEPLGDLLLAHLLAQGQRRLSLLRAHDDEIPLDWLLRRRFRPADRVTRFVAEASTS